MKYLPLTALSLAALSLAALTAATATQADEPGGELFKMRYECGGGDLLEVVYANTADSSYAIISQMDEMIPMQITPMASGASYKSVDPNYSYVLHTRGGTAELVAGDEPIATGCTALKD